MGMTRDCGMRNPGRTVWLATALLTGLAVGLWAWQTRIPDTWGKPFDHHRVFAPAGTPPRRPEVRPVPARKGERVPITRDTWLSNVGDEARGGNGGADRLKLKTYQELSLLDADFRPLRGRVVEAATLHLRLAAAPILRRVTVGTVAAPWVEGTAARYQVEPGSASFLERANGREPWSFPGSDVTSVILGGGHSVWAMSDATPPSADGWQKIAVEPVMIAANLAGLSHGLVVYDDQGLEWRVEAGGAFRKENPANRFVFSRSAGAASAPWLEIWLGPEDHTPPAGCQPLEVAEHEINDLPAGESLLRWRTPTDTGPAGPLGFQVEVDGQPLPRYLIPLAGPPGEPVELHLRDLPAETAGDSPQSGRVTVRCVDGAGNAGPPTEWEYRCSARHPLPLTEGALSELVATPPDVELKAPRVGPVTVSFLDVLDKVHPERGEVVPQAPPGYRQQNHLWDAQSKTLTLRGARRELVGWQLSLEGGELTAVPELEIEGLVPEGRTVQVEWLRGVLVETKSDWWPDPLVPFQPGESPPAVGDPAPRGRFQGLWGELWIPPNARPGTHRGRLRLTCGKHTLDIGVELEVWPWEMPDRLSFVPEMNAYGAPGQRLDVYRVAHRHRTVWNRVPYSQAGEIKSGLAPEVRGSEYDWESYDRGMGPLFDGTAFADLPRAGIPLETCYLPLHENWPTPIDPQYDGGYWADLSLTPEYRERFVQGVASFARHILEQGWNQTQFQVYLNNKVIYKKRSWSDGSSPWLLDEPASFQDFWAVGWYGQAFHAGLERSGLPGAPLVFRIDISRPQFQRDVFDSLLDYNVCAAAAGRQYRRLLLDNQRRFGQQLIDYGTSNPIHMSNVQPAAWCLESWARGADGVLPWNTVGGPQSWRKADQLAIFYPPAEGFQSTVAPSLRLKSYLRGQQDVEYLALWQRATKQPRWAVGAAVQQLLPLSARVESTGHSGDEDAGALTYPDLRPAHLAALRELVARRLLEHLPLTPADPRPPIPDRRNRNRNLRTGGYVTVGEQP